MRSARDRPGRLTLGGMLRSRLRIGRDACGFPATAAVSRAVCRCRAGGFTRIRRDAGNSLGWRVRVSSRSHRWRSQEPGPCSRNCRECSSAPEATRLVVGLIFFVVASRAPGWSLSACPPAHRGYSAQPPAGAGLFQLVKVVWAILLGESLVAAIFSTFSAFWLVSAHCFSASGHGWFGVWAADVAGTQGLYFVSWACLFLLLVIPRLKPPLSTRSPWRWCLLLRACRLACYRRRMSSPRPVWSPVLRLRCLLCLGTCRRAQGNGKRGPAPFGAPVIP